MSHLFLSGRVVGIAKPPKFRAAQAVQKIGKFYFFRANFDFFELGW
jgi:hypothetical protein